MSKPAQLLLAATLATIANTAQGAVASWTVKVEGSKKASVDCTGSRDPLTCLATDRINVIDDNATLTVQCKTKALCDKVSLGPDAAKPTTIVDPIETAPDGKARKFSLPKSTAAVALAVFHDQDRLLTFQVGAAGRDVDPPGRVSTGSDDCPSELHLRPYSGRASEPVTAQVVTDRMGNVLTRSPGFSFDENDKLEVRVIAPASVANSLKVERTSSFRDLSVVRIIGEPGPKSPDGGEKHADESDPCKILTVLLDDFAPGRGTVQISRVVGDKKSIEGSFDFQVHPLYMGILSLGWIRTKAVDPGFTTVNDGTQDVIAPKDVSERDNLYTLSYTPFIWGKRDPEKPWSWGLGTVAERVNPTIGLVVDDVDDNVLAGLSVDLPAGVLLTFGRHYRRVTVLSPQSGLVVGSAFTGTPDQIPTAKSWESETFVGLSIDLRAMTKFLAAVAGSKGG